jgi:prophage regulatory protein
MNFERSETTPDTILRLTEVLERTGLSRSTLYNRIAKSEFPHQISLGGRAVGWLNGEVENWINERILLRPGSTTRISERELHDEEWTINSTRSGRKGKQRPTEQAGCLIFVNNGSPDPAQLHLLSAKIYFDKSCGSFWLKLRPEK